MAGEVYTREEILESLLNCLVFIYKTDADANTTIDDIIDQAEQFCFGSRKNLH